MLHIFLSFIQLQNILNRNRATEVTWDTDPETTAQALMSPSSELVTEQVLSFSYFHSKYRKVRADIAEGVSGLESCVPEKTVLVVGNERGNETVWTRKQARPSLKYNLIIVFSISVPDWRTFFVLSTNPQWKLLSIILVNVLYIRYLRYMLLVQGKRLNWRSDLFFFFKFNNANYMRSWTSQSWKGY